MTSSSEPSSTTEEQKQGGPPPAEWWCNFCNLKTEDLAAYLAHSCVEELKKQGREEDASARKSCG